MADLTSSAEVAVDTSEVAKPRAEPAETAPIEDELSFPEVTVVEEATLEEIPAAEDAPAPHDADATHSDDDLIETIDEDEEAPEQPAATPEVGAAPTAAAAAATPWDGWIGAALAADRVGLAFHLATARDLVGGGDEGLAAPLLEGVLHGRTSRSAYDGAWRRYEALREPLLAEAQAARDPARLLLLMAGALRPALVQSQTALDIVEALEGDVAAQLNGLKRLLLDVRGSGVTSLQDLTAPAGADLLRRRAAAARTALEEWLGAAPSRKTNYTPANWVWQSLVGGDGAIGSAVNAAIAGADGAREKVRALLDTLADRAAAEAMIYAADEARMSRGRHPIEGGALRQMLNLCGGVADLLGDWLRDTGEIADHVDRHRQRRTALLRELRAVRGLAISAATFGPYTAVAAGLFASMVDTVTAELEGTREVGAWSADDELALLPAFPLNARHDIIMEEDDAPILASAAARALDAGSVPSPAAAFDLALEEGNASAATRLLPYVADGDRPAAAARLAKAIEQACASTENRARVLRQRLDDLQIALTGDDPLPDAIERDMSAFEGAELDKLPLDTADRSDMADFPAANRRLDAIESRLLAARAPVAKRLEQAITDLETRLGQRLEEPRALLAEGDLGTLAESVVQIERHGLAPAQLGSSVELLRRFGAVVAELGDPPSLDLVRLQHIARDGSRLGPFDFGALTTTDRTRAEQLLASWKDLRRAAAREFKGDVSAAMRNATIGLLTALGFSGVRVEQVQRDRALLRVTVATDPLRRREDCLVPAFGSEARGRYAILVVPDGEMRSALNLFDTLPDQIIVLATGALQPRIRRDLQRQSRNGTRSVALADAVTAAVLASEPDAGTRAFFDLALPFGAARPYADTSAQTSIEMFFGRENEYRRLVDRQGACLVYGGRQLGKTALLKQVELKENVNADRVAIYCDIRTIGDTLPPDEVWSAVERKLRDNKVALPEGKSLADRLRGWASAAPGRYMLVLLDEADAFLEREMREDFPQIGRMKTLMDDTSRSVKFVFAGLHNVQRFHRAPNSPLLHFGKSINVGPLLGSDREAARQMALEPMAAIGMTFDQPVDASHMLSLVGFYPSLMQSFGKAVVTAVDARLKQPGEGASMPFRIDRALIEECFKQQEFRAGVVERFQKTLQLDERYELLTYAVWQRASQDVLEGRPAARGYPASEIRRMADEWWPAGFRDTDSPDAFAALLDEMVEMGVLASEGERYALRSQRIVAMLGDKAAIEDRLQSFSGRAPKRRADPMTSHRRIGAVWSPMSLRQEAIIAERLSRPNDPAAVLLIGASPATGADDVADALTSLADKLEWPRVRGLAARSAQVIIEVAKAIKSEARADRPKLIVVEGWPPPEELAALRRHRVFRDSQQPVRVVFHGAPTAPLLRLPDAPDLLLLLLGPLPQEAMVHWMNRENLSFADQEEVQASLREATGGLLQVLDSIKKPPPAERQDPERLLVRARTTLLTAEDLGLHGSLESLARELRELIGGDPLPERELREFAITHDPASGADLLDLLRALGVIEQASIADEPQLAINPAAVRALA